MSQVHGADKESERVISTCVQCATKAASDGAMVSVAVVAPASDSCWYALLVAEGRDPSTVTSSAGRGGAAADSVTVTPLPTLLNALSLRCCSVLWADVDVDGDVGVDVYTKE